MQEWFCVLTRPRQEDRAVQELANQDFAVFGPKMYDKPLFPRYIFAKFDRDSDNWGCIKSTRGCVDVLKTRFQPIIVRQAVIDAVMAFQPPAGAPQTETVFTKGQRLKIKSGLLGGFEGLFVGTGKQRTYALLNVLGKEVQVPLKDIAAA